MRSTASVQITRIKGRACVHLKSWDSYPKNGAAPLPYSGSTSADFHLLTYAPGEWIVVSDAIAGPDLHGKVEGQAASRALAAVDLSHAFVPLRIEGSAARDVLSKVCALDLDPRAFPAGSCTRTRLAQLPVIVHCTDPEPKYDLYVGRSYFEYLFAWLSDAAVELQAT